MDEYVGRHRDLGDATPTPYAYVGRMGGLWRRGYRDEEGKARLLRAELGLPLRMVGPGEVFEAPELDPWRGPTRKASRS